MPKRNKLRKSLNFAEKKLRDGYDQSMEKFEDIEDSAVKYIKKNPIKSVAIAAGVGALVALTFYIGVESAVRSRMRPQSFWEKYNLRNFF